MRGREARSARAAAMAARVRAGLTLTAVGEEMSMHRSSVARAVRSVPNAPPVPVGRPRKVIDVEHAQRLRGAGASMAHVALRVGVTRDTLAKRLREAAAAEGRAA